MRFWILATTLGALVGAIVAVNLFPTVVFLENPIGRLYYNVFRFSVWLALLENYGSNVFGFSLCLAIPSSIGQWLALRRFLKYLGASKKQDWLWLLITTVCIVATVLPLWIWSAGAGISIISILAPYLFIIPLFPGGILLGIMQCLFLSWVFGFKRTWLWILLTTTGVTSGSALVFIFSVLLYLIIPPFEFVSMEVLWYTGSALFTSSLQTVALKELISS